MDLSSAFIKTTGKKSLAPTPTNWGPWPFSSHGSICCVFVARKWIVLLLWKLNYYGENIEELGHGECFLGIVNNGLHQTCMSSNVTAELIGFWLHHSFGTFGIYSFMFFCTFKTLIQVSFFFFLLTAAFTATFSTIFQSLIFPNQTEYYQRHVSLSHSKLTATECAFTEGDCCLSRPTWTPRNCARPTRVWPIRH